MLEPHGEQKPRRFAHNAEIAQNRVLDDRVLHEIDLGFASGVTLDALNSIENVFEIILGAFWVLAHTGWASSSTF